MAEHFVFYSGFVAIAALAALAAIPHPKHLCFKWYFLLACK